MRAFFVFGVGYHRADTRTETPPQYSPLGQALGGFRIGGNEPIVRVLSVWHHSRHDTAISG